jgi:hypothetical protein
VGNTRLLRYSDVGIAVEGEFETGDLEFYLRTDGLQDHPYEPIAKVDNVKGIVQYLVSNIPYCYKTFAFALTT